MVVFPNAKINLGLHVLNKRNDGFHNIETIMYPTQLCDVLEVLESTKETTLELSGIDLGNTPMEKNLVYKAWELFHNEYQIPAARIILHKNIPHGAGLGGGSADAAFMLKALNELFELKLSLKQLEDFAAKLGSDCPFFIQNKPAIATGRGEILSEIDVSLDKYKLVIVKPPISVPTGKAYSSITPHERESDLSMLIKIPIEEWQKHITNDFEKYALPEFNEISEIKTRMIDSGAIYSLMSGSGSSVFGLFERSTSTKELENDYKNVKNYFYRENEKR